MRRYRNWYIFGVHNVSCYKVTARRKLFSDVLKNNAELLKQWLQHSDSKFVDSDRDPDYLPEVELNESPVSNSV